MKKKISFKIFTLIFMLCIFGAQFMIPSERQLEHKQSNISFASLDHKKDLSKKNNKNHIEISDTVAQNHGVGMHEDDFNQLHVPKDLQKTFVQLHSHRDLQSYAIKIDDTGSIISQNNTQGFTTIFSANGIFLNSTRENNIWELNMYLREFGWENEACCISSGETSFEDNQVNIKYDSFVEWFINTPKGLEHGFTIYERPEGKGDNLVFNFEIESNLTSQVQKNDLGINLFLENKEIFHYGGLYVEDANGKELQAKLSVNGNEWSIIVDAQDCAYPITVDPTFYEKELVIPSYLDRHSHQFSNSVAIDGNIAVIGAINDNESGYGAGAAYIFQNISGTWIEIQKLFASNGSNLDSFGSDVDIDGETIIVSAVGTNLGTGSVYVFEKQDGDIWTETQILNASNGQPSESFGFSIAVDGGIIGIGAETSISYNDRYSGSVYIFEKELGIWNEKQEIVASDTGFYHEFGYAVDIHNERIVVGANNIFSSGISDGIYIFEKVSGIWTEEEKVVGSDVHHGSGFGIALSIEDDTIVAGAPYHTHDKGATYIFKKISGVWSEVSKLTVDSNYYGPRFGSSVSLSGNVIVVGAPDEHGIGIQNNFIQFARWSGAAYIFQKQIGGWTEYAKLYPRENQNLSEFGTSVAIDSGIVIVGDPWKSVVDQNGQTFSAGTAYFYYQ